MNPSSRSRSRPLRQRYRSEAWLKLDVGTNKIRVVATRPDFEEAREVARVTREEVPVAIETTPTPPTEAMPPTDAGETAAGGSEGGLEYREQIPTGRPGYEVPEDQRPRPTCVFMDAETGECVGD